MIILVDEEDACDIIQYTYMIFKNIINILGIDRNFCQLVKRINQKHTNIILKGGTLKEFFRLKKKNKSGH